MWHHVQVAGVVVTMLGLPGCARASDRERFESDADALEIVSTVPEPDAREVPATGTVDLCFSHRLDPRSIGEQSAEIRSGEIRYDTDLVLQLFAFLAPGGETPLPERDGPWCPGSVVSVRTRTPLMPSTLHRLQIDRRIRGWNGEQLEPGGPGWFVDANGVDRFSLEFEVGPAPTDEDDGETDPAPTLGDLFAPGAVFDPGRAACGCHRGENERAQALLDLATPETAYRDLVIETRPRDTDFPMVTPYRSAESFFIHKLLRDPGERGDVPILGVLGQPMPEGALLPYADLVMLARWIEGGAQP